MEPNEIGQKIKAFRKQRQLSQMELAERINVSFQQVQKYENGKSQITMLRLAAITQALNIPITEFLEEETPLKISEDPGSYTPGEILLRISKEEASFIKQYRKIRSKKARDYILKLLKVITEIEAGN